MVKRDDGTIKNNDRKNDEFGERTIELLRYRGFHAKYPNILDDVFYQNERSRNHTFFLSRMSIDDMINLDYQSLKNELFKKDSVYPQEVCFVYEEKRWSESFGGTYAFYEVRPDCLDPYIARYVRAINRCGMKTYFSCDGWHSSPRRSKEAVILFDDRYSWLWHQLMCQDRHMTIRSNWKFIEDQTGGIAKILLPGTDQGKQDIYKDINLMAEMFEQNLNFYQMLKLWVLRHIDSNHIDFLKNQDVRETFIRLIHDLYKKLGSYKKLG